jgi:hypothetical protein
MRYATCAHGSLRFSPVGRLLCFSTPRVGRVPGSAQSLRCVCYAQRPARQYIYEGRIRRVGLDLGVTGTGPCPGPSSPRTHGTAPALSAGQLCGGERQRRLGPWPRRQRPDWRFSPHRRSPAAIDRDQPRGGGDQSDTRAKRTAMTRIGDLTRDRRRSCWIHRNIPTPLLRVSSDADVAG